MYVHKKKTVQVICRGVPVSLRRKFKLLCVLQNVTMNQKVLQLMKEAVAQVAIGEP